VILLRFNYFNFYLCIEIEKDIMDSNCSVTPKPKPEKGFFKSQYFWKPFIGIVIGGLAGFLYYYFIGCKSGTCAITSNPWNSILMGGLLGFSIAGSTCTRFRQLP
jgi:hypothetical protein